MVFWIQEEKNDLVFVLKCYLLIPVSQLFSYLNHILKNENTTDGISLIVDNSKQ